MTDDNDPVMLFIRYDEEFFKLTPITLDLARSLRNKLSHLQYMPLKYSLINKPNLLACSSENFAMSAPSGKLFFEGSVKQFDVLNIQCCGNNVAILSRDFDLLKISIFTEEKICSNVIKFAYNGHFHAILRCGLFFSTDENLNAPLGFYKDISFKNGIICLLRENGDAYFCNPLRFDSVEKRPIFKFLGCNVKKISTDGDFFALLFEDGTVEFRDVNGILSKLSGNFIDVECGYCYAVAIRIDNKAVFWHSTNADDPLDESFVLTLEESQNVKSVYCGINFYILHYYNNSILGKGVKNGIYRDNILEVAISPKRCMILDDKYNHFEI